LNLIDQEVRAQTNKEEIKEVNSEANPGGKVVAEATTGDPVTDATRETLVHKTDSILLETRSHTIAANKC